MSDVCNASFNCVPLQKEWREKTVRLLFALKCLSVGIFFVVVVAAGRRRRFSERWLLHAFFPFRVVRISFSHVYVLSHNTFSYSVFFFVNISHQMTHYNFDFPSIYTTFAPPLCPFSFHIWYVFERKYLLLFYLLLARLPGCCCVLVCFCSSSWPFDLIFALHNTAYRCFFICSLFRFVPFYSFSVYAFRFHRDADYKEVTIKKIYGDRPNTQWNEKSIQRNERTRNECVHISKSRTKLTKPYIHHACPFLNWFFLFQWFSCCAGLCVQRMLGAVCMHLLETYFFLLTYYLCRMR